MPSRQNAARIDPAVWELHRTEVHTHYILEDKSLSDVMAYMKEKHNFHATKSQYGRQLDKWKFRKNLTSDEWEFAIGRMNKRKQEGKENELFIDGFRVPRKRIRKEILRGRRPNETAESGQVQTPEGISVRTPQSHAALNISLENLPWIKFQNHIESRVRIGRASSLGITGRRDSPSLAQSGPSSQEPETPSRPDTPLSTPVRLLSSLPSTTAEKDPIRNIPRISQLQATILESQMDMTLYGFVSQHSLLWVVKLALYLASNNLLSDELAKSFLQWVIELGQYSLLASVFKEKLPTIEAFASLSFKNALHIQDTKILKICLQAGANPNLPLRGLDGSQYTPLEVSMYHYSNIELIKVLLDAGAHTDGLSGSAPWNRYHDTALAAITALFNIELAHLLINLNADLNGIGCWSEDVLTAAAMRNIEPIRTLYRAAVGYWGTLWLSEMALLAAAANCNIELVQILLKSGVAINTPTNSWNKTAQPVLVPAAASGHIGLVKILMDAGAYVNGPIGGDHEGKTALQAAAEVDNIELVQILLNAGANVNAPPHCRGGRTALQAAAERGNIDLVQILLRAGANVNAPPANEDGVTALQAAAAKGKAELVRILLDAGAGVNSPPTGKYRFTPLQAAAADGNIELAQILLEAGADVNAPPARLDGSAALQAAASKGNNELVRILLDAGADVNAPPTSEAGKTALQAAVMGGNIELVQALLDAGANVNDPPASERGMTALQDAVTNQNIDLVQVLIDAGADVNAPPASDDGVTALQAAAMKENIELVQILLNAGADVNAPPAKSGGVTALQAAAGGGNSELVQILLTAGADVKDPSTTSGITALEAAAYEGHIEVVRILLDAGTKVDVTHPSGEGGTALQAAAAWGHVELVRMLLREGANPNAPQEAAKGGSIDLIHIALDVGANANGPPSMIIPGGTVLQAAVLARHNGIELVKILIEAGADINACAGKRTALQAAVLGGNIGLVRALLDAGADVNASRGSRVTALQEAVTGNRIDLVQLLLDTGADINAPAAASQGRTALQAAAESGNTKMVQLLLNKNADINAPPANAGGVTALQGAAIKGHLAIALLLLQAGADVTAAPAMFMGQNALEGAAQNGRLDMVQLLLDASADTGSPDGQNLSKAAMLAERRGHHVVAKLLRDYPG